MYNTVVYKLFFQDALFSTYLKIH